MLCKEADTEQEAVSEVFLTNVGVSEEINAAQARQSAFYPFAETENRE